MKKSAGAKSPLDRDRALASRPERIPAVRTREADEGKLEVTVYCDPPRWMRFFGGKGQMKKSFRLDVLGREVYDACNGKSDVRRIIKEFANRHKVSRAEAELAVTNYLNTLIQKGLISMAVDRKPNG